jgi:hypothetical protein
VAQQFERKYRVKGDELTDDFFNSRFRDIDLRVADLETRIGGFDEAVDALIARGLDQINTQLQASIAALQLDVAAAVAQVEAAGALVAELEDAVQEIISGSLPATGISVADIDGADNVQEALELIRTAVASVQSQLNGIGDIIVVDDMTEAATLTGLDLGDVIHVKNNGSSKWARYQVTTPADGTWANATKVVIFTQDQAPASHVHAIADVTGLQTALDGKAAGTHAHIISDVTGLQTALDGKEAADADIIKKDVSADLGVGYKSTSKDQGTKSSGTFTPSVATGNIQHYTNNGAHTLAPFTDHTTMVLDVTNGASAGAITVSGFTKTTGDTRTTTNGHKFRLFISVGNGGSHLHTQALQ